MNSQNQFNLFMKHDTVSVNRQNQNTQFKLT